MGTLIGAVAGYIGGWLDNVIMRMMDVLLAFPGLLLAIAIVTVLARVYQYTAGGAIVSIPVYARVVRASVIGIKELDYVLHRGRWVHRLPGFYLREYCPTRSRR